MSTDLENRAEHLNALLRSFLRTRWQNAWVAPEPLDPAVSLALVEHALAEHVAPLLYRVIGGRGILSPQAEEMLRWGYWISVARSLALFQELEKVLRAFSYQAIPVLLLKGAALGPAVYGDPALRPLGDLDLLVRPADVPRALGILASNAYRPVRPPLHSTTLTADETQILLRRGGTSLELHWELLDSPDHRYHLPMEPIWSNARPLSIGTSSAWMLGPEDQVIYLCAHLVLHHSDGRPHLLWFHDIGEVIAHDAGKLDWSTVLERAGRYNLLLPLRRVLPQLAADWQVPIPPAVLEQLREMPHSPAERRLSSRLIARRRSVARRFWDNLAGRPVWTDRLRFAWSNLFPSPAYMRERYGIRHLWLLPFYYPYRWFLGLRSALLPHPKP